VHHHAVRFAGDGDDLWHVRVDLIAPDDDGRRVTPVADELRRLLNEDDRPARSTDRAYLPEWDASSGHDGQTVHCVGGAIGLAVAALFCLLMGEFAWAAVLGVPGVWFLRTILS
jgi:hypothetical protein